MGTMKRDDLEKYIGWTLDDVSGGIPFGDGGECDKLRLQFRSPDGRYANIFIAIDDTSLDGRTVDCLSFSARDDRAPFIGGPVGSE